MKLEQIPTPALILDKAVFDNNRKQMASILEGASLKLRPHYKSHKCAQIAHLQMADGAVGMSCAKLDEALDLADSGIEDILIANQVVDPAKLAKLAHLANTCRLTVCVDNEVNILALEAAAAAADATIHCLIEYEIGMERCGVRENEEVAHLANCIGNCAHLVFEGIQAYAGHISHMVSLEERRCKTAENAVKIRHLLDYLDARGIQVKTLSGGSTGTAAIKASEGLYTELQAGSYLFMDSTYRELNMGFENALFLLTTVVSVKDGLVVVDAGVKSCGVDQGMPLCRDLFVSHIVASEEHFQLHSPSKNLKVGDKVLLIPGHCCSTVNLHDRIYVVDNGMVEDRYLITAQGCFR